MNSKTRAGLVVCLVIAAVVRLLWVAAVSPERQQRLMTGGDDQLYVDLATNLLAGRGYAYHVPGAAAPQLTAVTPPGTALVYAAVFAVTGASVQHLRLANVLLDLLTLLVVVWFVRRVTGSDRAALLAGWCWALWPVAIFLTGSWSNICLATCLVALVLAAHLAAGERPWAGLAVGLATGLAVLVRPAGVVLPLALLWWPASTTRSGRSALRYLLLAGVGIGLVLTPWLIRNAVVMGRPTLASQSAFVLYRGWSGEGLTDAEGNAASIPYRPDQEMTQGPVFKQAALNEIRQHPGKTLRLAVEKVFRLWLHLFMRRHAVMSSPLTLPLALALGLLALGLWRGDLPDGYRRLVGVLVALVTLLHVATYAMGLYALPFYPLLMPAVASGLGGGRRPAPGPLPEADEDLSRAGSRSD